ncbi:UV DNA damage repair endonuclease UvsE [Proteinivorax hydrogeniformans]|uniref:UV DNA damage repair endonuclease UvsE n=1 Tax=Proteinivorax hydrogeniformans TaxID=1826727 RepID=A0AAU8HR12_9FIRM
MKIGYACVPFSFDARINRGFRLSNLSEERFFDAVYNNLEDLGKILKWNIEHDIFMFRISSDIIPFGSHPNNDLKWQRKFKDKLLELGNYIKQNGIRVSMHPGQYTVINSPKNQVVKKSIDDLSYHCQLLDSMGLDYQHKIVLHCGGVYGDKNKSLARLKANLEKLPEQVLNRLVLENDDKSYDIADTLSAAKHLDIPVVFDILHHQCNHPKEGSEKYWLRKALKTWGENDGSPKIHYSNQAEGKSRGSHSLTVDIESFMKFYRLYSSFDMDIMLEVKDKELSALKCVNSLKPELSTKHRTTIWAFYKYSVMEKDYSLYKQCSKLINSDEKILQFYKVVDKALFMETDYNSFRNAAEHIWGYFKKKATFQEKQKFFELLEQKDIKKIKRNLWKLTKKYNDEYLKQSYFFCY